MMTTALMRREDTDTMATDLFPEPHARVIVVEDDDEMRAWVREVLLDHGYEVHAVADSLSALVQQLHQPADVVITDWKMPDMDGLKLVAALRRCSPGLPVIMVTAYPEENLVRQVQEDGAFSCLAKPFRSAQLLAHVQGALLCARLPRTETARRSPAVRGARDGTLHDA